MTRRRKRPDEVEMHEQGRRVRQSHAPKIEDKFPGVNSIRINLTFEDFDRDCDPKPQELNFFPESTAFFEHKCPFRECVMGGFDFSATMNQCIRARQSEVEGELKCQGWQDRERINHSRCLLKARHGIHFEYSDAA